MSQITLSAATDRVHGSASSRRLRIAGSIPGVMYGEGVTPVPLSVNAKEFRTAVSGEQGLNSLINLEVAGKSYTVLARELQRHKVRGTVAHIDFQVVDPNKPVVAEVPLHVIGDAVEVRHADWEVDQQLFNIEVKARPSDIPTFVNVDINELKPGGAIRISDLTLPAGVEATADPHLAVVATFPGRAAKQTEAAAAPEPS
ncbi:MAG: 50S ribosomal protein L25 [Actinomycetota bacterium]|jgi:large subunit ribosomal protein L25